MRLTRVYVADVLQPGATLVLPEEAAAHVHRVMRLRVGDGLIVFDGRGGEYPARIVDIERARVTVQLGPHRDIERESPLRITLWQALARGERMDTVVQKATELGVAALWAWEAQRSVVQLREEAAERRCQHWLGVCTAAAEQCGRTRIPEIRHWPSLSAACAHVTDPVPGLILDPQAVQTLTDAFQALPPFHARALHVIIGPEGGLTEDEQVMAARAGFVSCHLGPRILRTETAPLAALAILQALAGDLRLEHSD